jgi:lipopolysaccharide transport protein LptA
MNMHLIKTTPIFLRRLTVVAYGFILATACAPLLHAQSNTTKTTTSQSVSLPQESFRNNKEPTYIKSDMLKLDMKARTFIYTGSVEAKNADMTIYCDKLEGNYNEQNQVEQLTALKNVLVLKGETIRATGGRGVYSRAADTVVLTENPELIQSGNVLTADAVTINLTENRSSADGRVRVKLVNQDKVKGNHPAHTKK